MQEKVLSTISDEILSRSFNCDGRDMLFKDYLLAEVLPYIDLSKDKIMLKSGIEISLKEFIEQSIFYICQNRYYGNFIEFAKDNLVDRIEKREVINEEKGLTIGSDDKTYVFFEELSGPKYLVVIGPYNVVLACRDGKYDIIMKNVKDKKDFLKRIKKLDFDMFVDIYNKYDLFRTYIKSFSKDKIFYNSLMVGIENKTPFDNAFDSQLSEMTNLIKLVESGDFLNEEKEALEEEKKSFEINEIPSFDTSLSLNIVMKKCRAFYSEFVNDIDGTMAKNNILEKAEYIIDDYLGKIVDHIFYEYVKNVAESISNNSEVVLNYYFIRNELEEVIINLKKGLKRLFVNPSSNHDTVTSDVYINIISDAIQAELIKYEEIVNHNIKDQVTELGINLHDADSIRKVS